MSEQALDEPADVTVRLIGATKPEQHSPSAAWLVPALISFAAAIGGGLLTSWTTTHSAQAGKLSDLKTAAYADFANAQGSFQSTRDSAERQKASVAIHQASIRLALYGDEQAVLAIANYYRIDAPRPRCLAKDIPDIAMYEKIREGVVHQALNSELRSAMAVVVLGCDPAGHAGQTAQAPAEQARQ